VVLTGVLVEYLIRTDPLALGLSVGWIVLGAAAYVGLRRVRAGRESEPASSSEMTIEAED